MRWLRRVRFWLRWLGIRVRFWFWKTLHSSWWGIWWVTESTINVPVHWRWWPRLGYWLYRRKMSTSPSLIEAARPGERFCCSWCGYVRDGEVGTHHELPAQGSEGSYTWPPVVLGPLETVTVSLEVLRPFVLERISISTGSAGALGKLSVVDLRSGGRSLFTQVGPFPASLFREGAIWGVTFGRTVTRTGEELVLVVANLSGDEVELRAGALGRCFNTFQEGTDYLADN
jgi:hypothetical protein